MNKEIDYQIIIADEGLQYKTFIDLGVSFFQWSGVKRILNRECLNSQSTFLFYRKSPPTIKKLAQIVEKMGGLQYTPLSEEIVKELKKEIGSGSTTLKKGLNGYKKLELNFKKNIEKLKLIQLGQIYGEYYDNVTVKVFDEYYCTAVFFNNKVPLIESIEDF